MINLIKNELIKIFHKKGLYIYAAFILVVYLFSAYSYHTVVYKPAELSAAKTIEANLGNYNLNNEEDVEFYISDKEIVDIAKILEENNIDSRISPEYYYIQTKVSPAIIDYYRAKLIKKDEALAEENKKELDRLVEGLKTYDWKKELQEEKKILEALLKETTNEYDQTKIKDQILAIDCRIKNDVPPSYSYTSETIDVFLNFSDIYNTKEKERKNLTRAEEVELQSRKGEYFERKYQIEHDILPDKQGFDNVTAFFDEIAIDILIAIFVIAGGIIAEEFNKGTIKQLFVRPFKRSKILTSKFIAAFITLILFILFYIVTTVIYDVLAGADINKLINVPTVIYNFNTDKVVVMNSLLALGLKFLLVLPEYIFYLALCLLVGIITTNTVASIAAIFLVYLLPSMITFADNIAAFIPYNCLNLNSFLFGRVVVNQYQSLLSSIIVDIVSIGLIFGLTYFIFKKKDVKNQ